MKQIFGLLIIAFLASCGKDGFQIKGEISGMPEQPFYLEEMGVDSLVVIDSSKSDADGKFSIKGKCAEPQLYRLRFGMGKYIMLTLHNESATVRGDWNKLEDYRVEGSEGSASLKTFLTALREHIRDVNSLDYVTKNLGSKQGNKDSLLNSVNEDLKSMNTRFAAYVKQFADTTTLVPNAVFAANIINPSTESFYLKNFFANLRRRFPTSQQAKLFADRLEPKYANAQVQNDKYTKLNNGKYKVTAANAKPATGFSGTSPNGKTITLSDYKGKYVLIDFWASWCGPCRAENPKVLATYRQFKDKNFDILGVSLDGNKDEWTKAIKDDGLAWQHISELKRWQSVIARQYNISSIPSNVLVDPDGNIVATNLHGNDLEEKLTEIFSNPE